MIVNHNKQAKQIETELILTEKERLQLNMRIDEIQKEKELLVCQFEEDRKTFENRMQKMMKWSEAKWGISSVSEISNNTLAIDVIHCIMEHCH